MALVLARYALSRGDSLTAVDHSPSHLVVGLGAQLGRALATKAPEYLVDQLLLFGRGEDEDRLSYHDEPVQ
jgi:hypothetical protein